MADNQKTLNLLYGALNLFGLDRIYSRLTSRKSAIILMYHSISTDADREWIDPDNDIPLPEFEAQMEHLSENCNVVSMDELCSRIRDKRELEPRSVVITFDDGYRNNLDAALEVLERHDFPATLYLATGYVDRGDAQWIDELYSIFQRKTDDMLLFDDARFDLRLAANRDAAYERAKQWLLTAASDERREFLERLRAQLKPVETCPRLTLTWREVGEMLARHPGVTVGVHTRDHVDLTGVDLETVRREIRSSLSDAAHNLKLESMHFSYPYGRWNERVRLLVEQSGLGSAVATDDPAAAITLDSDVYSLPRVEVPKDRRIFRLMVSGAYPGLPRLLFRRPHNFKYHNAMNPE